MSDGKPRQYPAGGLGCQHNGMVCLHNLPRRFPLRLARFALQGDACDICEAAPAFDVAGDARAAPAPKTIRAHFSCNDGKAVDATLINGTRSSVKLVLSDGRKLSLPQALSASG